MYCTSCLQLNEILIYYSIIACFIKALSILVNARPWSHYICENCTKSTSHHVVEIMLEKRETMIGMEKFFHYSCYTDFKLHELSSRQGS